MTRFALLVVGLALAGVTGCAQCDTCDDFPAPCVGPNCGQNGFATGGFIPPTQAGLPQDAAMTTAPAPGYDQAPAIDNNPGQPSPSMPPATDPAGNSPPLPTTP